MLWGLQEGRAVLTGLQEDKGCLGPHGELSLVHLCLGRVTLGKCSVDACVLTTPPLL